MKTRTAAEVLGYLGARSDMRERYESDKFADALALFDLSEYIWMAFRLDFGRDVIRALYRERKPPSKASAQYPIYRALGEWVIETGSVIELEILAARHFKEGLDERALAFLAKAALGYAETDRGRLTAAAAFATDAVNADIPWPDYRDTRATRFQLIRRAVPLTRIHHAAETRLTLPPL